MKILETIDFFFLSLTLFIIMRNTVMPMPMEQVKQNSLDQEKRNYIQIDDDSVPLTMPE